MPRTDAEWHRRCKYAHKKQCVRILKTWHNAALLIRCVTGFRVRLLIEKESKPKFKTSNRPNLLTVISFF